MADPYRECAEKLATYHRQINRPTGPSCQILDADRLDAIAMLRRASEAEEKLTNENASLREGLAQARQAYPACVTCGKLTTALTADTLRRKL
jgi:hypothetical protein